jgi:hypothetical protein
MRGVENIQAMRLNGQAPSLVFVEMLPMQRWTRVLTQQASRHPDIHLEAKDIGGIALADLRCLVGLSVMVNGPADDSTERVAQACMAAGAKDVQAFFIDPMKPQDDWIVKAQRYDAEGVRTVWPK